MIKGLVIAICTFSEVCFLCKRLYNFCDSKNDVFPSSGNAFLWKKQRFGGTKYIIINDIISFVFYVIYGIFNLFYYYYQTGFLQ